MTIYRGSASAVRCSHAAGITATPTERVSVTDKAVVLEKLRSNESRRQTVSMAVDSIGGVGWARRAAKALGMGRVQRAGTRESRVVGA